MQSTLYFLLSKILIYFWVIGSQTSCGGDSESGGELARGEVRSTNVRETRHGPKVAALTRPLSPAATSTHSISFYPQIEKYIPKIWFKIYAQ